MANVLPINAVPIHAVNTPAVHTLPTHSANAPPNHAVNSRHIHVVDIPTTRTSVPVHTPTTFLTSQLPPAEHRIPTGGLPIPLMDQHLPIGHNVQPLHTLPPAMNSEPPPYTQPTPTHQQLIATPSHVSSSWSQPPQSNNLVVCSEPPAPAEVIEIEDNQSDGEGGASDDEHEDEFDATSGQF